jgi:hypothetical protein
VVFWVFLGGFFGLVFYCQPCLLLLQLHRVEDAEENLGNGKEKKKMQESFQNDTGICFYVQIQAVQSIGTQFISLIETVMKKKLNNAISYK